MYQIEYTLDFKDEISEYSYIIDESAGYEISYGFKNQTKTIQFYAEDDTLIVINPKYLIELSLFAIEEPDDGSKEPIPEETQPELKLVQNG